MTAARQPSRTEQIWQVFDRAGGRLTTRECAEACYAAGVFGPADTYKAQMAWAETEVRKALKQQAPSGLQHAYPTPQIQGARNADIWVQPELMGWGDCVYVHDMYTEGLAEDWEKAKLWHDYMLRRFNDAPPLPVLTP